MNNENATRQTRRNLAVELQDAGAVRSIFIPSHGMTSSVFCDKILLLKDGQVAAFDSHDALMKGHNLYRDLFETQAKNYKISI